MWGARAIVLSLLFKGFFCEDRSMYYKLKLSDNFMPQLGLCVLYPCTFTYDEEGELPLDPRGLWHEEGPGKQCQKPVACSFERGDTCAQTRGRFRLVGDPLKKDCSLRIDDVRESDSGIYFFRYENRQDSDRKWSYKKDGEQLHVKVQGLTDKPEITIPDGIIEGQEVTVNCTPPGRCMGTPPNIMWDVELISTHREYLSLIDYNNGTKFNVSSITFNASRKDHRKHLNCTVLFPAVGASTARQHILNIQYPPVEPEIHASITDKGVVVGTHNTSSVFIREGLDIILLCAADSNPSSNLTWMKGESIFDIAGPSSNNTLALSILTINSSSDAGVYQCQANNALGKESSSITINVQYAPRIPNIEIEVVPASDNSGLEKNGSTAYVLEGKTFHIHCDVDSVPIANLTWTYGGDRILETSVNQKRLTLSLENVAREQDGQYWCVAQNKLGTANTSLHVSVKYVNPQESTFSPIIVGVLAGVVFMAAVFMLGWLFIRKGRRLKNDNTNVSDKQEMVDDDTPIYSEIQKTPQSTIAVSNGGAEDQPSSGGHVTEPTENLYGNLGEEDLQYASIDFSKLKPRNSPIQPPEETLYSDIKVK